MVAIVTGTGFGLERSSGFVLGARGVLGGAAEGRFGSNVTVNAANGNLVVQRQDEILLGLGPDSVFSRTYNSLGAGAPDMSWQKSIQRTVVLTTGTANTAGSTATRTGWDGAATVYTYSTAKSAYISTDGAGAYDSITLNTTTNVWTWLDGSSQASETYDKANNGRITASIDTDGNQVSFTYGVGSNAKLNRVTTADGNYTDLSWTGNNLTQLTTSYTDLITSTTKTLTRTRYGYDTSNRLVTVTTDLTPGDNSVSDGNVVTTTYAYDGTSTRIASISETGSTNMVQFTYALNGAIYRIATVVETAASGDTRTTSFTYNASSTSVTDPLGNVTTLAYDANGNLTQVTYPPAVSGATAQTVVYAYNANGDVTSVTDSGGKVTAYSYDANGNLLQERDPAGNTIDRTYGSKNELLTATSYLTPDPDGPGAGTASVPVTTRYAYDSENHLRFTVSAEGKVIEYQYNSPGLLVSTIGYTANLYTIGGLAANASISEASLASWASGLADRSTVERTDTTYDFRGNVATVTRYSAATTAGVGLTTALYERVTYVYDQAGQLLSRHPDNMTGTEVFTYDGLGRVVSSTDLTNATTSVAFNDGPRTAVITLTSGATQTSVYDMLGELVSSADAGSGVVTQTTSYKYDKLGRQRIVGDAASGRDFIFYDNAGRKTGYMDQSGFLTEYVYDAANRLTTTIEYATALTSTAIASLYDAGGNPTTVAIAAVRPAANTSDFWYWNIYDSADRVVETINSAGFAAVNAYDGASRLISTINYTNLLTAAQITGFQAAAPTSPVLPAAAAASDRIVRNFYDNDGLLTGTLDGIGALVRNVYDGAGRKIAEDRYASFTTQGLRASGTFAALLASVTSPVNAADQHDYFAYDDLGNLRYTLDANLRPTELVYDGNGNVIRTVDYGAPIASTGSYSLAYIQGQIGTLNLATNAATRVSRAVYDGAGRKIYDIDAEGYVSTYGYDSSSRVIKQTRYAAKYTASGDPAATAMASWASSNGGASDRIDRKVYDTFGRVAYEVDAEGYVTEHQYDLMDRVTKDIRYATPYVVTDSVTQTSLSAQIGALPATAVVKTYAYNSRGELVDSYDGNNIRTHYEYYATGELLMVSYGYGTADLSRTMYFINAAHLAGGQMVGWGTTASTRNVYVYDGAGNLKTLATWGTDTLWRAYDNAGNLIQDNVAIAAGNVTATTYRQYDAFGNVTKITDPNGNIGYFYYDKLNRLVLQIDAEGYATETTYGVGDQPLSVTRYYTKTTGASVTAKPTLTTDAKDEVTTYAYDKLDRAVAITDAVSYTESYTLNAFGDRISVTNKLGGVTTNQFDKRGLLIAETLPISSYSSSGDLQASSVTNRFSYDARGNRTQMIEADNLTEKRTTTYTYDKGDRLTAKTGDTISVQNGSTTTSAMPLENIVYDARGNVIETKTLLTVSPSTYIRTLSYYDAADRKIAELNAAGTLTVWTYDGSNNKTSARVYGDTVALPANPGGTPPAPVSATNYRETLYAYDYANRLIETRNTGVDIGERAGGVYQAVVQDVVTTNKYDASGNIVSQTDGRGSKVFFFYDRNNRKIAQVDQENYLTTYDLDGDGNVTKETRYATRLTVVVGTASSVASLRTNAGTSTSDHVTDFTYDRNGRRLTETRSGVAASTVDGNGALTTTTLGATVSFSYNGLGLVTRKTEANGDFTDYAFDLLGRNTQIKKSGYIDYNTAAVQPVTDIQYDGVNQVSRQLDRGTDNGTETDDRITTYYYDKAGRLILTTDATGFNTLSSYDLAGRVVKQSWYRAQSNGALVNEALLTTFDLLGRQTSQVKGTWNGSSWTLSDTTDMLYNGYGDMIGRGINTGGTPANFQEFADYDKLGRVWRSNFGDGVTKGYAYDANGNVTLLVQTTGAVDLRTMTLAQMVANANATKTQSVYDKRNQLIETVQQSIENAGALAGAINATTSQTAGTNFTGGAVEVGATRAPSGGSGAVSGYPGAFITSSGTGSLGIDPNAWPDTGMAEVWITYTGPFYGGGTVYATLTQNGVYTTQIWSGSPRDINYHDWYGIGIELNVKIYQDVPGGQVLLADFNSYSQSSVIQFQSQSPQTAGIAMFVRPQGSSGPYHIAYPTQLLNSASAAVAGWFTVDPSQIGAGSWDVKYYAMDAAGNTLNSQTATLYIDGYGNASTGGASAQTIGGTPKVISTQEGGTDYIIASEFPSDTAYVIMRYRAAGSSSAFSSLTLSGGGYGRTGLFYNNVTNWGGPYEYWLEAYNNSSTLLLKSTGTFTAGSQPSALTNYADLPEYVYFSGQPTASGMTLWYKPAGTSNWTQAPACTWNGNAWVWDANSITTDKLSNYVYDFKYEVYNNSVLVNQAHGQVQLGFQPATISNIADTLPATVSFVPPQANAATLILNYRPAGSTGAYTTVTLPKTSGKFEWNVESIRPASGSDPYEYYYDLLDGSGNAIPAVGGEDHARGYIDIQSDRTTNVRTLQWTLIGSSDPAAIIDRKQGYDAFGNIVSETDGLNHVTNMTYNVMNKLIEKKAPETNATAENGTISRVRPTDSYYYDISGRLVGARDANNNLNTLQLLAGTGHDAGGDAVTLTEYHADGGKKRYGIDVFGDVRKITDELGFITANSYDKLGRLTQVVRPARTGGNSPDTQLTDNYAYDGLGQRIKHWNSLLGAGVVETTDYDVKGRVTSTVSFAGQATGYSYVYATGASLPTSGLGAFGGWQTVTTMAGRTSTQNDDIFGRITWKSDFGGHSTSYSYDKNGQITTQTNSAGQSISYAYYGNGYIRSVTDNTLKMVSTFEYDKEGNRTLESYTSTDAVQYRKYYQVAKITYDELNRISTFTDAKATISYEYDANNNRRNVKSVYHDGLNGAMQTPQDYWYKYDSMNRFVLTMGTLQGGRGGTIVKGADGVDIGYDAASQRVSAVYANGSSEAYTYTADGYLEDSRIGGVLRARRTNDAMGRVTSYIEYAADGVTQSYNRASTYDNDNRVTQEVTSQSGTTTTTTNDYRADVGGGSYTGADQGVITHSTAVTGSVTTETRYGYAWWDQAKQATVEIRASNAANPAAYNWAPGASLLEYDANGHLARATISGGAPRIVTYENDAYGQVLVREEKSGNTIGPRQLYYYFNGNRIGDVGNNGPSRVDYATQLAMRGATKQPGAFRYGGPVASADFDQNYEPINAGYPGAAATSYTVRAGDTLAAIAQALWGDRSMWYLIADANGLTGDSALAAGQRLIIPNKVTNIHNRAGVYRVYDPGEAIGDTLPTLPPEPMPPAAAAKHGGCGLVGKILLVAVAVAVAAVVGPAIIGAAGTATTGATGLTAALGSTGAAIASGAAAGIAGSVVSQGVGLLTGIQDQFSWKSVGLAAIAGGVGGGLSGVKGLSGGFLQGAARGALANAATQGIAVATGLQGRFDWTGVAVGAAVGGTMNLVRSDILKLTPGQMGNVGQQLVAGMAGAIAGGLTRSVLNGTDFGDNIMAALPDVIGATIGNTLAAQLQASGAPRAGKAQNSTAGSTATAADDTKVEVDSRGRPPASQELTQATAAAKAQGAVVGVVSSGTDEPEPIVVTATNIRNVRALTDGQFRWFESQGRRNGWEAAQENGAIRSFVTFSPLLSLAADLTPGLGTLKSVGQLYSGKDLVTNEPVNRWMEAGGLVLSMVPMGRIGAKLGFSSLTSSAESVASRIAEPSSKFYSVAFETKLSPTSYPGISRGAHFQEANGSLLQAMEGDAAFASDMQSLGINLQRTPTGLASRTSPSGWTWHHAEKPGVMQLVPRSQHQTGSIFQGALHPEGKGGYSIWGK